MNQSKPFLIHGIFSCDIFFFFFFKLRDLRANILTAYLFSENIEKKKGRGGGGGGGGGGDVYYIHGKKVMLSF